MRAVGTAGILPQSSLWFETHRNRLTSPGTVAQPGGLLRRTCQRLTTHGCEMQPHLRAYLLIGPVTDRSAARRLCPPMPMTVAMRCRSLETLPSDLRDYAAGDAVLGVLLLRCADSDFGERQVSTADHRSTRSVRTVRTVPVAPHRRRRAGRCSVTPRAALALSASPACAGCVWTATANSIIV